MAFRLPAAPARNYDSNQSLGAKRWKEVWAAGQGVGAIRTVEPVGAVVDRLAVEYRAACDRLAMLTRVPVSA